MSLLFFFMFRILLYVVLFIFIICTPPSLVIVRIVFSLLLWVIVLSLCLCIIVFCWFYLCMTWSLGFDPNSMFSLTPLLPVSAFNDILVSTSCLFWPCLIYCLIPLNPLCLHIVHLGPHFLYSPYHFPNSYLLLLPDVDTLTPDFGRWINSNFKEGIGIFNLLIMCAF